MSGFLSGTGNWTEYRKLPGVKEVDFHHEPVRGREWRPSYGENMAEAYTQARDALVQAAQDPAVRYVLFTHGRSTSRPGKTTARSQVRSLMRSKEATPYIIRKDCIQHDSVFVAAIRKGKQLDTNYSEHSTIKVYHVTSNEAADLIEHNGFRDRTSNFLADTLLSGVWVSDSPLDENEGARCAETCFSMDIDEGLIAEFELIEEGKPYREWLIPAAVLNAAQRERVNLWDD